MAEETTPLHSAISAAPVVASETAECTDGPSDLRNEFLGGRNSDLRNEFLGGRKSHHHDLVRLQ